MLLSGGLDIAAGGAEAGVGAEAGAMFNSSVDYVLGTPDLLKSIFQHLDLKDVCTAASTCRVWHQVANDDDFWKEINFKRKKVQPSHALALLRRHPKVEELDLSGLVCGPDVSAYRSFVKQISPFLGNLRKLSYVVDLHTHSNPCHMALQLILHLSELSSLTALSLTGTRVVCVGNLGGTLEHPALRELTLDGTESSALVVRCPQLTYLSMAEGLNTRMLDMEDVPALLSLDLSRCIKLAETSTRTALMRLTSLQVLNIMGMTNLLDQTIQQLATTLVHLTRLNMSRVTGISLQGVRGFPALKELDLSRCDQLTSTALTLALESFESLERLTLDSCNLASVKLSMPKLKALSVRGCPSVAELEVRCWQLTHLDMGPSECFGLINQNLAKLTVSSGALKRMEWVKLHKLSCVDLDCPSLAELYVRECSFSEASVLQALGDTCRAPTLQSNVLEVARRLAAHPQGKPGLAAGPSGSDAALDRTLELSEPPQGRVSWVAPAAVDTDDDEDGMDDVPMPDGNFGVGGGLGGNLSGSGDEGDDGDDDEGPAGAARCWATMGTRESPAAPEQSWDGPDRLPPELVRFGVAMPRSDGPAAEQGSSLQHNGASSSHAAQAAHTATLSAVAAAAAAAGSSTANPPRSSRQTIGGRRRGHSRSRGMLLAGGASSSQSGAASAAAAAAAGDGAAGSAPAAGGRQPPRCSSLSGAAAEAFGFGVDWIRGSFGSRRSQGDRGYIWGSSGDRLQAIGGAGQAAGAAAEDALPDKGRRKVDRSSAERPKRKSQRLEARPREGAPQAHAPAGSTGSWLQAAPNGPAGAACSRAVRSTQLRTLQAQADGDDDGDSSGSSSDSDIDGVLDAAGGGLSSAMRGCSRLGQGKGGVPGLRVLHVEGCERLQELLLSHLGLQELLVCGCGSMVAVALHAPQLNVLEFQELGDLRGACLQEVNVPGLTLGSCSSLLGVEVSSSSITRLDVRGCGGLQQLWLDCPTLQVLDANFCGSLGDEGLAGAVTGNPPLQQLSLSVCCQIGSGGLSCLSQLTTLHELDLSYTEVNTLQPILDGCPHLQSLSIASCRSLGPNALQQLLDPSRPALPQLQSLDASYCDVEEQLVAQLLIRCKNLKHLALNGCAGVTDTLWQQLQDPSLLPLQDRSSSRQVLSAGALASAAAAAGAALMDVDSGSQGLQDSPDDAAGAPCCCSTDSGSSSNGSKLESLSLVRCSNLHSLCLGLLPASGTVELLSPKHYLLTAERAALQAAPCTPGSWVQVPSAVSELSSLKVGLSGVQVVALALPKLSHLDLSSCKHLRVLELRCPLLLQLQLQACRCLPLATAVRGVLGAPHLQMLDIQHMLPQGPGKRSSADGSRRNSNDADDADEGTPPADSCSSMPGVEMSASSILSSRDSASNGSCCPDSKLLAAVAAGGELPPVAGRAAGAQLGMLLDEVAATHGCLKPEGILRCSSICKICSKLAQCSL